MSKKAKKSTKKKSSTAVETVEGPKLGKGSDGKLWGQFDCSKSNKDAIKERVTSLKYRTFGDYVTHLISKDMKGKIKVN